MDRLARDLTHAVHDAVIAAYGDTDCHCEQASVALAYLLKLHGVDARVVAAAAATDTLLERGLSPDSWLDHCWVNIDELGLLCDPTIDQFRAAAPVYVTAVETAVGYNPADPANWNGRPPVRPDRFEQIETCSRWGTLDHGWDPAHNDVFHRTLRTLAEAATTVGIR